MSTNELANRLREAIRIMERKLGILEKSEVSCCGITLAQCHALVEIGRAGSISLNELADILNLDNSTMSRSVNNLVNSNYAVRELDPADRRYVTIQLTTDGRKIFEEIEQSMGGYYTQILNAIPEEKRQQVLESFQLLLEAIDRSNCCAKDNHV